MKVPELVLFGDDYYRRVIYALAAYIANYEEQVLLSCILRNWCAKCIAHRENLDEEALHRCHEHSDVLIEEFEFQKLREEYGIAGDLVVSTYSLAFLLVTNQIQLFTNDFPRADIHHMLSPDILHQLIKGGFKDHLVDWVKKYLIREHGKADAEKILDKIDVRHVQLFMYTIQPLNQCIQDCSCRAIHQAAMLPSRTALQAVDR